MALDGTSNLIKVTDADFEEKVLKEKLPVLVDFWAEWCGPCKTLAPILDETAKEYADPKRLIIAKVDVDSNQEAPAKYGVRGIPALILFKNGEQVATQVGALSKKALLSWLAEHI